MVSAIGVSKFLQSGLCYTRYMLRGTRCIVQDFTPWTQNYGQGGVYEQLYDERERIDDIWFHRYRKIDRDDAARRTGHEIQMDRFAGDAASVEPMELDRSHIPPERLSREGLAREIYCKRDELIDCIDRCNSHNIVHITGRWAGELLEINLFNPEATKEIRGLRTRIDKSEKNLPVTFSLFHPGIISTLSSIPDTLRNLEELCTIYQDKFGGTK